MYYPIECLKILNIPYANNYHITYVKSNNDRTKICTLTKNGILIWLTASNQLIAFHVRSNTSVRAYGENCMVDWRSDSSKIAILTTTGYLLFYQVVSEHNAVSNILFGDRFLDTTVNNNFYQYHIVNCKLKHETTLKIQKPVDRIYNYIFDDELFLSLKNGEFIKFNWKSLNEFLFLSIKNIQLKIELTDNAKSLCIDDDIYAIDFEITHILGAICMALVLSDGSAAYLVGENTDSDSTFQGLVAQVAGQEKLWKLHTCVAINPLYQLLAYGCKNGQAIAYYPDEVTLSLQYSNLYQLNSSNTKASSGARAQSDGVIKMKWTPDYRVLVTLYENGAIGMFSVFGSLLFYSNNYSMYTERPHDLVDSFKGMDFSTEGYSLWLFSEPNELHKNGILGVMKFVKSSLTNNPAGVTEHIILQGENRVKICLNLVNTIKTSPSSSASNSLTTTITTNDAKYNWNAVQQLLQTNTQAPTVTNKLLGGNNIWQIIDVPLNYISTNYPIRYVASDKYGKYLAVAGMYGFTHYSFATRKWKLFGNASQEKDMTITCGLVWWKDFICLGCFNFHDGLNEIRFYSRHTNLDNHYASTVKLNNNITKINVYEDILVILCSDCNIILYGLESKQKETRMNVVISKLIEFSIENYVSGNPFSVLSIALSDLKVEASLNKTDTYSSTWNVQQQQPQNSFMESILINVSGRLLVLQRDKNGPIVPARNIKKLKTLLFQPPLIIASCVENMWTTSNTDCTNAYMKSSLWLSCGANGMKVWMPLSYKEDSVRFQSHRIMLSFQLNTYPLAILINEAVILGITNEYNIYDNIVYNHVFKTTQIFLDSLLIQLLRKNLDFDALQIAKSSRHLQHFTHILELLLHQILELEATSSEPIPDPLLPRIVVFIHEFTEFLQIVSHCTRKTDIALWPYLFIIVGNPSNLFEECLAKNYLETASSYLIILQNTVKSSLCKQYATTLLEASLNQSYWRLSKDIIRFLTSIDPIDLEKGQPISITDALPLLTFKKESFLPTGLSLKFQQNITPNKQQSQQKTLKKQNTLDAPSNKRQSVEQLVTQQTPTQQQQLSQQNSIPSVQSSAASQQHHSRDQATPTSPTTKQSEQDDSQYFLFDSNYIEKIISNHALNLLKKYKLKKLGYMFANLRSFSMLKWLKSEPQCSKVDSFVEAILMIHTDFHWPLPIPASREATARTFSLNCDPKTITDWGEGSNQSDVEEVLGGLSLATSKQRKVSSASDSVFVTKEHSKQGTNGSEQQHHSHASHQQTANNFQSDDDDLNLNSETEEILMRNAYLNLITQELANRGPTQSEVQLKYLIDVFLRAECYEWAFIIALVLKNYTVISEILFKYKSVKPSIHFTNNFNKGLNELVIWAKNEFIGYGHVVQNIVNFIDRNCQNAFDLTIPSIQANVTAPQGSSSQTTPNKMTISSQSDAIKVKSPTNKTAPAVATHPATAPKAK